MSKQDSIISLLKEINKTVYNSDIETAVDLVVTENDKEYSPNDYNADAFRSVKTEIPKIKVTSIKFDDNCLDSEGNWDGRNIDVTNVTNLGEFCKPSNAKKIDLTGWNVSNNNSFAGAFINIGKDTIEGATIIGIEDFDTSVLTRISSIFANAKLSHPLDLRKWNVSNVNDCAYLITNAIVPSVNLEGWDLSKTIFSNSSKSLIYFHYSDIPKINIAYTKIGDCAVSSIVSPNAETIVGDYTIDDVISKDIYVLKGIKHDININKFSKNTKLNRASLRAVINGLVDLTGSDTKTLNLGETLIIKLTEEDIAIATAKNWTIA